jgi:hypothetical protein
VAARRIHIRVMGSRPRPTCSGPCRRGMPARLTHV